MNYKTILILSFLLTNFLSHGMETKPSQEAINEANCALRYAASGDDLTKVQKLIRNGVADINSVTIFGCTPLMIAARNGNADIVNALIQAGANVNSVGKRRCTALIDAAAKYKNADVVDVLIQAGANVNHVDKDGNTALTKAIKYNDWNIPIQIINPSQKSFVRKKIETLLAIYNKGCSWLSDLPKELLKIIITYAHPEYAMDCQSMACLHPEVLVDNVPLKMLAMLIKDGIVNQGTILEAWQKKITAIVQSLKIRKTLNDNVIQKFESDALTKVTMLLTSEES